jgi:arabinogalactan oligomer / maltooligosaccharide transport system permease protein
MLDLSKREVLAGLAVGLLLGLGLMSLLRSAGSEGNRQLAVRQTAVVTAAAAADAVAAARSDTTSVQATAEHMVEVLPLLQQVRVVHIGSRQLEASTVAGDDQGGFPRRLSREEKPWYDLARELRAAHITNVAESEPRKDEVLVAEAEDGRLEVTLPLMEQGEVGGAVLVEVARADIALDSPTGVPWWLLALGTFVLGAVVVWYVPGHWLRVAVVAVLLLAALFWYGSSGLDALAANRVAAEAAVRDGALTVQDDLRSVVADPTALDPVDWAKDRFGRPRGFFDASGAIDNAAVGASYARDLARFQQALTGLGVIGLALAAWIGLGWTRRTYQALVQHRFAYGFVLPAMIGMILLVIFPFAYGVVLSFTKQTLYNVNQPLWELWIGLDNYIDILSDFRVRAASDVGYSINFNNFYWTLFFTILWTVSNVTIGVTVGLILALILNAKDLRLKPAYRVILILPWAVPNYITALIWRGMFHQQFGVVNQVIQIFGGEPLAWFDAWYTSFFAVLATNGWLSFPFMMVVSLGALQSIPGDLYEAARVDGASRWQQFRYVTLPSLKPALVPAIILSVVWTFNMFNIIYLVSGGQPAGATEILITDAYKIAFEQYRYGYAAAYSTVIFLVLLTYGIWQNRVTRATEGA